MQQARIAFAGWPTPSSATGLVLRPLKDLLASPPKLSTTLSGLAEAEVRPYHTARARKSLARLKKRTEDIASDVLGGERKQAILAVVAMQEMFESPWRPETEAERQAVILQQSAGRLVRLDRYESRALARRRRALRDLQEARLQAPEQ